MKLIDVERIDNQLVQSLENNHLQSLKSLCQLLLREVELLTTLTTDEVVDEIQDNISLSEEVERFETNLIRSALIRSDGRQNKAARLLGVKLTTLNTKIKRYGISITDYK